MYSQLVCFYRRKGNKSEDIHTVSLCVGSGNESEFTGGKQVRGYNRVQIRGYTVSLCVGSGTNRIVLYMYYINHAS